jgi:hypothetical protein
MANDPELRCLLPSVFFGRINPAALKLIHPTDTRPPALCQPAAMPRKKEADVTHPRKSHPTLTPEEARERERQRQRDRRAQRRLERTAAVDIVHASDAGQNAPNGMTIPTTRHDESETNCKGLLK